MPQAPATQKPPGKRGYWWSGGLAITAVLLFGLGSFFGHNPIRVAPDIIEEIPSSTHLALQVTEDDPDEMAVFVPSEVTDANKGSCTQYTPEERLRLLGPIPRHTEGYGGWTVIGTLDTSLTGTHIIDCSNDNGNYGYVIASTDPLRSVETQQAAAPIVILSSPPLLLAAIVVGVVTALRRSSARKLALAIQESTPHSPYPQQAPQHPHPPQHPHQR